MAAAISCMVEQMVIGGAEGSFIPIFFTLIPLAHPFMYLKYSTLKYVDL
jgi:hypothetical protein